MYTHTHITGTPPPVGAGASLVELASGHVPHEEDAKRVAAEISAFVARHTMAD